MEASGVEWEVIMRGDNEEGEAAETDSHSGNGRDGGGGSLRAHDTARCLLTTRECE